jgi:hypothetical protein
LPDQARCLAFVAVFLLFAIEMNIVAGKPAPHQQGQQDSDPSQSLQVPGALVGNGGACGFHHGKRGTAAEDQLQVPRHQVEVGLPSHLAPHEKQC